MSAPINAGDTVKYGGNTYNISGVNGTQVSFSVDTVRRSSRRYDQRVLEQLLYMPEVTPANHDQLDWLTQWGRTLETQLNSHDDAARKYRDLVWDGADDRYILAQIGEFSARSCRIGQPDCGAGISACGSDGVRQR